MTRGPKKKKRKKSNAFRFWSHAHIKGQFRVSDNQTKVAHIFFLKRCKIKYLISHVGQVSFHGIGILPICVVFGLYFTNPVKGQDSRSVKAGAKTGVQHIFKLNFNGF